MKNKHDISGLHQDVEAVKEETIENSLRIGQTDDDIAEIYKILQKLNERNYALEQEISDLGKELRDADEDIQEDITSLGNQINNIQEMPLGSIVSWAVSYTHLTLPTISSV